MHAFSNLRNHLFKPLTNLNRNGKLDAGDAQFANFKLMLTNANGTTSLQTLAEAGVLAQQFGSRLRQPRTYMPF